MTLHGGALPDFPWDALIPLRERAAEHPDGLVDLSIGTPVDPTPRVAIEALSAAADAPGYPPTIGTGELREAITSWWRRRRRAKVAAVLPTVGSKEMVALLPALLGIGAGDAVVHPATAYPTYDVGARLAGAIPVAVDGGAATWPENTRLVWLNSPGNPHGHVLSRGALKEIVSAARSRGIIVASDECYAELPWAEPYVSEGVPSLLDSEVTGDDHSGLLALYSLSKQSNLAGYRAAFIAGDPNLISRLAEIRKHAGFMVPAPVQAAMAALLRDDDHVRRQRDVYGRRRSVLQDALEAAGFATDPRCAAGLYLWAKRPDAPATAEESWRIVNALANLGILAAPGVFYGVGGHGFVRMALSASDDTLDSAARRLRAAGTV